MVNALVAGSQPRGSKRPKFPTNNLLRITIRTIYSRLERKFTFPDSMQSEANMPVFDAIVRQASEGIDFRNEFCDSVGALRVSKRPQVMAAVTTHYDTQRRKWKNAQKEIEEQQRIALEQKCLRRKQRLCIY
ncbi:hypothetical protein G6F56_013666 [Rhizopus delemar]|nr:hypothetical protein G6F56_013943 [Rhizopus delemar]KAG1436186.1 hypothetical protein G6F56_013666 [Rhizopus delemar]